MKQLFVLSITILLLLPSCNNKSNEEPNFDTTLISNPKHKASCVRFASDENNNPVVSWCETDEAEKKFFYLSFFEERSQKFSKAISIPIEQNAAIHEEGMPKVAIKGDGTIVAVYETVSPTPENGWAGFIHYIQSFDKGKSWTKPLCVHLDTTSGKTHSFADITRLSNGEIGASWLDVSSDYEKNGRPVKFAKTNGRNGFGNERLVDSLACECCRTAISSNEGKISIVFRDIISDSIRDISVSTSTDNGDTFSPSVSFSNDDWVINGCPHNGPSVVNTKENVYATWFTGGPKKGVYYCELSNNNKEVIFKRLISQNGKNIQLCLSADGSRVLAYNEIMRQSDSFYSRIIVNKIGKGKIFEANITSPKAHASYPVIHAMKKDNIVVAWTENDKVYCSMLNANEISKTVQKSFVNPILAERELPLIKLDSKKDPACGMPVRNGTEDTTLYEGKIMGFCSKDCKEAFVKNPKEYKVEFKKE